MPPADTVNGFTCRNCTDVDYAKKHIDPAHPRSGPYNINAQDDPSRTFSDAMKPGASIAPAASDNIGYSAAGQNLVPGSGAGRQLDTLA